MTRGTLTVVAVLVLGIAGVAAYLLWDDGAAGEAARVDPAAPTGSSAARMDVPRPRALDGVEGADAQQLDVAPTDASDDQGSSTPLGDVTEAPAGTLSGRVTWLGDGGPAAGLQLSLLANAGGRRIEPLTAETDATGHYRFTYHQQLTLFAVEVEPDVTSPRQQHREERSLELDAESTLDFEVHHGALLAGVVVDTDGAPVSGATVHGWSVRRYQLGQVKDTPERSATTNGAGTYQLPHMGPPFVLTATAHDLAAHTRLHGEAPIGERVEGLELVLSAARELRGRVIDTAGRPIAGARIQGTSNPTTAAGNVTGVPGVYAMGPSIASAESDAGGRFVLEQLASRAYSLSARHADHQDWSGTHAPGDGELVITMNAGLTLSGTVTDGGGSPVAGAKIRLSSSAFNAEGNEVRAETDEAGVFTFSALSPDKAGYIAVSAEGFAVHVVQPVVIAEGMPAVDVRLQPERRLAGHVVDLDGAPVAGALVSIEGDREVDTGNATVFPKPMWENQFGSRDLRTEADGAFRFAQLYDARFTVQASDPEGLIHAALEASAGREDLVLVLDPDATIGVTLVGVARDALTGLPLSETFFVTPMMSGPGGGFSGSSTTVTHDEGRYRVTALEPGLYLLNASSKGYAPWSAGAQQLEEGEHRFDIDFLPNRTATFRFVDQERKPVSLRLSFEDEQGQSLMVESSANSRTSGLQTDDDGRALAAGLPAARIQVQAKRGLFGHRQDYTVDLRNEPRGPIELVYAEQDMQSILVVVVSGSPSEPLPVNAAYLTLSRWVQAQASEGRLRAPSVPVTIHARDAAGASVGTTLLDPAGENAVPFPVEGLGGVFLAKLDLPATAVDLAISAEGVPEQTRPWTTGQELCVILLGP